MTQRIDPHMSLKDIIVKMSDGNPGTLMALSSLAEVSASIDPDSAWAEFSACVNLDSIGIYGKDIWVLYKDICKGNPALVHACLRACQLGLFPEATLKDACSRQDRSGVALVPVKELYDLVRLKLANFDPNRIGEREEGN